MIKKSISILLALVMILSIFTIIPVSTSAEEAAEGLASTGESASYETNVEFVEEETAAQEDTAVDDEIEEPEEKSVPEKDIAGEGAEPEAVSTGANSDFSYNVNNDGTVTIKKYIGTSNAVTVPDAIDGHTVASLGSGAFSDFANLYRVILPASLTKMEAKLFQGCKNLKEITIPKTVTVMGSNNGGYHSALYGSSIEKVTFEDGRTFIPERACSGMITLKTVIIPQTVTEIKYEAFSGCRALTENGFSIPSQLTVLGARAFADCDLTSFNLPSTLTTMGAKIFQGCTKIKEITIPKTVTTMESNDGGYHSALYGSSIEKVTFLTGRTIIPERACCGLTTLKTVIIPQTVTEIKYEAFSGCRALTENGFSIPSQLTVLGARAFADCDLTSFNLPSTLTTMGAKIFQGCTKLKEITIPKSVTTMESNDGGYHSALYGSSIEKVTFQNGRTVIPERACSGLTTLKTVIIPQTVTEIKYEAFSGCRALTENGLSIPNKLTVLNARAFADCDLTSISLPSTLTKMEAKLFQGCTKLKEITIPKSVTTMESNNGGYHSALYGSYIEVLTFEDGRTVIPQRACADVQSLKSIILPDSVIEIKDYAFQNVVNTKVYCRKYSKTTITLLDMKANPVSSSDTRPEATKVLDTSDSKFYFSSSSKVKVNCSYKIKDSVYANASNYSVKIYIPDGASVSEGSLYLDKKFLTDYKDENNSITIPVTAKSGRISFSLDIDSDCKLRTYAILNYRMDGKNDYDIIDVINESIDLISLNAEDVVSSDTVTVSGIAPANADIDIYVDDDMVTTLKANKAGMYIGDIALINPMSGTEYVINALSTDKNGNLITAEKKINYLEDAPELTDFTMTYNGKTYNLLSDKKQSVTFVLESFHGRTPFSFNVKYNNPESIGNVYISSVRNQTKKSVDMVWDEASGSYVFNGYFDENDHDYVPGKILVEYTDQRPEKLSLNDAQNELNTLINDNKEVFADITTTQTQVSDTKVEYNCDLEKINALYDLGTDTLKLGVETFGNAVMDDWGDLLTETFSTAEDIYSYFDKNGDKYLMKQDFTKEGTWVTLIYDVSSNKILKYILDGSTEFEPYSFTPSAAEKLSSGLSFVSSIVKPIKGIYDINEDYDDLMNKIDTSGMNYQEQAVARQKAQELKNDRMAFLAITTVMSALAIGMTGPVGIAASLMLASIGILGDYFYSMRTANILSGKYGSGFNWSIDPSGYVYAGVTSNRVSGAKVTAWWIPYDEEDEDFWENPDESIAVIWDASEYSQVNPLITDNDGNYAWDVPEGLWKVIVEKDGYETYSTGWLAVPPPQTDININLMSTAVPDLRSATYRNGVITLSFSEYMKPETMDNIVVKDAQGTTIEYTLDYEKNETDIDGNVFAKEYYLNFDGEVLSDQSEYTVMIKNAESFSGIKNNKIVKQTSIALVLGDVDLDGYVEIRDATWIQRHVAEIDMPITISTLIADVDGDGYITVVDATAVQYYLAKLRVSYPIGEQVTESTAPAVDIDPSDYEYQKNSDNTVTITKYNGLAKELTIPGKLDGCLVTAIGKGAFERNTTLESVVIPNTVSFLDSRAFGYCSSLKSVTIPESVTSAGQQTFVNCTSLTEVVIPRSLKIIPVQMFYMCSSLQTISLPDTVKEISSAAFTFTAWYNDQPDGLLYLGKFAYVYKGLCPSAVTIKPGTVGIADYAFYVSPALTSITIPNSVKSIGECAFKYCNKLSAVDIPDSVTDIGEEAFFDCKMMEQVTIPYSVTSIGRYSFGYYKMTDDDGWSLPENAKKEDFIVCGYKYTEAERYANNNEFAFRELSS